MKVLYFFAPVSGSRPGISKSAVCEWEEIVSNATMECDLCDEPIRVGNKIVCLTNIDEYDFHEPGERYYLHRNCADRCCMLYENYLKHLDYYADI